MKTMMVLLLVCSAVAATSFMDTFDSATFWYRTGGTGNGYYDSVSYSSYGWIYGHTTGAHCSYYRYDPSNLQYGEGWYEFDVYGPYWEFAWRISTTSSSSGTCHRLGNYPNWWQGYFIMLGAEWNGPNYGWQSSSWGDFHTYECPHPSGLHHIIINDTDSHVVVWVDGTKIFDMNVSAIPTGTVGLGCGDVEASAYSPWYDNLSYSDGVGLTTASWGAIKALSSWNEE